MSLRRRRSGVLVAMTMAVTLAVMANDGAVESQALDLGDENSWIRVQNLGTLASAVEIDFYTNSGQRVASDACPKANACGPLPSGFGRSFFQQTLDDLPQNYRGSAVVSADQPFTALLARDVLRSDGEFQIAGDALRLGPGAPEHVLPWVVSNADYVSRIVVQNPNPDSGTCAQIIYYQQGQTPRSVDPATASQECASGGYYLAPNASWVRDEHSLPMPFGFDGGAIVRTQPVSGGASSGQVQVTVDTRDRSAAGLATYRSFSRDEASRVVLLPLVDRNHSEGQSTFSTRFRILSANPLLPNEVTLRFNGRTPAGEDFEVEHTITISGARTCDQRATGTNACLPDGVTLPNQFSGTVRMQSIEPVAVVAQRLSSDGSLADYRGFTAEEASTQVVLPVLNKNFGPFGGNRGWNSWFRVLTFDGSSARVYVVYYSSHFPDGLFPKAPLTVQGQMTFRQWENRGIPDAWVGSAVVISDRPIVVVANLESDVFEGDPVMLYNGVALE
ncbi:MAG: hypothetical protein O2888_02315 [Chloroflexi bacterium]|nr:hypothetical protein [Chloroflexota bacterium]